VVLHDIPEHSSDIRTALVSFMHSSKHIQHEIHLPAHVPYLIEGLAAILGVRRRSGNGRYSRCAIARSRR